MSADNVVVIIKEQDGKLRGYARSMSMYSEGQYTAGPCRFCGGVGLDGATPHYDAEKCEECVSGYYTPPEEDPIFEVDTIEQAVHAYYKWCKEMEESDEFGMFVVEYGFRFEGLEPNAETTRALKEMESHSIIMDNLQFLLASIIHTSNKGHVLANITVEDIKKRLEEVLANLNKLSNVKIFDSVGAMFEELDQPSDTELLDFLQQLLGKSAYTGKVICRDSITNRGWRMHETSGDDAVFSVRQAIINYMKLKIKEE